MNIRVNKGQFFVVLAEVNTGIIVYADGTRNFSEEIPLEVFDTLKDAEQYSQEKIAKLPNIECNIYDGKSNRIKVVRLN